MSAFIPKHTRVELEQEFPTPGWHGSYPGGAKARRRELRRYQAEDRNAATPPERRRVHRKAMQADEEARRAQGERRRKGITQRAWIDEARKGRQ